MMLHSTNFPYDVVGNDSAYFLNKVTLFCDVLTCALFPRVLSFVNKCFHWRSCLAHVGLDLPMETILDSSTSTNTLLKHLQHRDQWSSLMRLLGNHLDPRVLHPSGRKRRAPLPHQERRCNFIHPKELSPFPERLELPYPI